MCNPQCASSLGGKPGMETGSSGVSKQVSVEDMLDWYPEYEDDCRD